jgi:diadenosine tetraphosphatase ApaH/serine/threonine PP2A family protein phosphatase
MRHLVLSDIHSNLEAFSAVLDDAGRRGFDRCVVLGDIVGYGASPNETVGMVRELEPAAIVRGNHDKAACGITEAQSFNDAAKIAVLWTRDVLSVENRRYLRELPQGPVDAGGFVISHGSPLDEEEYILGEIDAGGAFEDGDFEIAFFGHTHFACVFVHSGGRSKLRLTPPERGVLRLEPGARYLINPGSIGQPRDHDPKAAYAIFDAERRTLETFRVAYDVQRAQSLIEQAGLPPVLGERLLLGY